MNKLVLSFIEGVKSLWFDFAHHPERVVEGLFISCAAPLWGVLWTSLFLVGCAQWFDFAHHPERVVEGQQQRLTAKTVEQTTVGYPTWYRICVPNVELVTAERAVAGKAQAMRTAEDVLGQMHFTIAKSDAERGYIRTRPLAGAQFFEFWRSDNVGAFNWAEANLHSIRRIVELKFRSQPQWDTPRGVPKSELDSGFSILDSRFLCPLIISCDVRVQRLSLSECEITSSARAYKMFSESSPSKQKLKLGAKQKAWVDLGKDRRLATEILKQISSMLDARRSLLDIQNRESRIENLHRTPNGGE